MNIVVFGSGNIATHLATSFHSAGHNILQVYSKTSANARALADAVFAVSLAHISDVNPKADLYLIAVSDSAITTLSNSLPPDLQGMVVHCSGATPITVLDRFRNYGVIYPPQSLNKTVAADISGIPFALEANTAANLDSLQQFMEPIAPQSFACNSQQRLALHIAAVFVNNFPNALYQIAQQVLEKENLPFDLLRPIILETAQKVQNNLPKQVQTGPAQRNDRNTINTHLNFLAYSNTVTEIYQCITDFIIKSRDK